jgi:hypothetical protein
MPSLRKMLSKAGLNFVSRFVDQEARRLACLAQDERAWPLDVSEEADDANAVRPVDRLPGVSLAKRLAVRCEPDILFLVDDRLREAAVLIEEDVVEAVVVLHDVDVEAPGSSRANIRVNKRFEAGIEGAADRHGRRRGSCEYERRQYRWLHRAMTCVWRTSPARPSDCVRPTRSFISSFLFVINVSWC